MGKNTKKEGNKKTNYLIHVEWPKDAPPPRFRDFRELFEGTGLRLDENYSPVRVNDGKYAIRGAADDWTKKEASQLRGVKFFIEMQQNDLDR